MLFGGRNDGGSLKDLERNAKALRLQAKHGPITPNEPLQELCPRLRSAEDYGLAVKQVNNPTQLAVALFFWPSSFGIENPMQNANCWLLEAEGLPQGDGHKAELLVQAIQEYDSATADSWVAHSVETALQMLEVQSDAQEERRDVGEAVSRLRVINLTSQISQEVWSEVGEAVKKVAELAIADFGDTIETSEIDLLNTIDACVRLPEIRGVSRAGDAVFQKQLQRIDSYLDNAYRILKAKDEWTNAGLEEAEIQSLISGYQQARCSFALLQRRPALVRTMPADRIGHLSLVSVALAYNLGTVLGRWDEALRLTSGIDHKNIDPTLDHEVQVFYQVACLALPFLRRAAQGQDVRTALGQIESKVPDSRQTIERFQRQAETLRSNKHTPVAVVRSVSHTGVPPPVPHNSSVSKSAPPTSQSSNKGAGCLVAIGICFLLGIASNACNETTRNQTTPTAAAPSAAVPSRESYRIPRSVAADFRQEKAALEQEKASVEAMFTRANQIQREIDSSVLFLDRSNRSMVAEHNRKVDEYNALVANARVAQATLNARVDAYNTRLHQVAR